MTIIVRDGTNTARTITAIQVRDGTNTTRDISEIHVRDSNNVSRLVFSTGTPLSASASPEFVSGFSWGSGVVTTDSTTVTPAGGTAPYTYAWTVVSYSNPTTPTVGSPSGATTNVTQTGVVSFDEATIRCTVTDDNGATTTVDVGAFFANQEPPGFP